MGLGGGGAPQDRSVELRQLEIDAENRRRAEQQAEEQRRAAELAELRNAAMGSGRNQASQYFVSQGLEADPYMSSIERELASIMSSVPRDDPNPGTYFQNVGQRVFDTEQDSERARLMRQLDQIAPAMFENKRLPFESDDAILDAIRAEMSGDAEGIARNMQQRGVITDSGFAAAMNEIARQDPRVRALLTEQGNLAIEGGRQQLRDVVNPARETVSNLRLGTQFNPYDVGSDVDSQFAQIMEGLGGNIRARLPKNLFDTTGLATVAGQAQGAQNTQFNPAALAGLLGEDDEDKKKPTPSPGSGSGFF